MAITSTGLNAATNKDIQASTAVKDKTVLGKDDFMKLFLTELQNQDPTAPMDTEKVLTQTSQLAALESADNTNTALEKLSATLSSTDQFSTIAAIGKRADLGSDAIAHDQGSSSTFEMYFPEDVSQGTINVTDFENNLVATIPVELKVNGSAVDKLNAGVYQFSWDGLDNSGNPVDSGNFHINAEYVDPTGAKQQTRVGAYPIESVKFDNGKALVKLGSNYVPIEQIKEVY